jgi:GT2 family glycosyltransferase
MNKLSIALVTWNGEKYMRYCLESLLTQSFQDFHLYVLDNGSQDNTVSIVRNEYQGKFGDKLTIIQNKENVGFAGGHNQIMGSTDAQYHMILNQDTVLEPEYLLHCVATLDEHPQVGSVSGKIYQWRYQDEEGSIRNEKTNIIDSCGLQVKMTGKVIERFVGKNDEESMSGTVEVFGVSGTMPVFRMQALRDVAYEGEFFDTSFFSYKEDVDLAFRLQWRGWRSMVVGGAHAYHDRSASSNEGMSVQESIAHRKGKRSMINYHSYKNHLYIIRKNYSWGMLVRRPAMVVYEKVKFLWIILFERSTFAALGEYVQHRKEMKRKHAYIFKTRTITDSQMLDRMKL